MKLRLALLAVALTLWIGSAITTEDRSRVPTPW